MSTQRDIPQIASLRERVESRFGKRLSVHADFLALVAEIELEQRQHISESTLERVWGYSTRGYSTVSLRTLDVLAHYAAGCNWRDFCAHLQRDSKCESQLFNLKHISTSNLKVGDSLQIGWLPNRVCIVEYLGENRFVATHCENSKIQEGDTFTCLQFTLGQPLVMYDLCRNDNTSHSQTYTAGTKNGLIMLKHK